MKTYIIALSLIALFLTPSLLKAQDVIMKNDSTTIESKVLKIDQNVIEYKKWSNPDGPIYTISTSDVISITYQNGDVDRFAVSTNELKPMSAFAGPMYRAGHELAIDKRALTKEEAEQILNTEQFNTYVSAKAQMQIGNVFAVVFVGSLFWDFVCFARMVDSKDQIEFGTWSDRLMLGAIISDISCPLWLALSGIGKGRLNWVASDYNNSHQSNNISLQVAPTLLNCEMPQLQNNYSLGMTVKMTF